MKKILSMLVVLLLGSMVFAQTGREIAEMVEDHSKSDTIQARLEMRLISSNGDVNTRVIDQFVVSENDLEKAMVIFQSPANVQGTRFLTIENENRDDDRWIYLPNLRRTRRIAGSEGSDSFMGSEFSYDDLSGVDIDENNYRVLREEVFQGEEVWVLEMTAKEGFENQYEKVVSWISKEKLVALQVEMYGDRNQLEKRLTVSNITSVQGIWTPIILRMNNLESGNSTELEIKRLVYNSEVPNIFTTNFLETGRL